MSTEVKKGLVLYNKVMLSWAINRNQSQVQLWNVKLQGREDCLRASQMFKAKIIIEAFEKNIKVKGAKAMECDSTKLDPTVLNAFKVMMESSKWLWGLPFPE